MTITQDVRRNALPGMRVIPIERAWYVLRETWQDGRNALPGMRVIPMHSPRIGYYDEAFVS